MNRAFVCPLLLCAFIFVSSLIAVPGFTVFAQDGSSEMIEASEGAPPAPDLLQPANGATTTATDYPPLGLPTLKWMEVPGAEKYRIQLSVSPGFGAPVVDKETYATAYTPEFALTDGAYYWRVQVGIQDGFSFAWGPFSDTYTFTKDWRDGENNRPELLTPEADAIRSSFDHGDFQWMAVPGAATYLFQIATDSGFGNVLYESTTVQPAHTPLTRLAKNIYYWRVIPLDNAKPKGNAGAPSEIRSFTFDWAATPQLLSPEDNVDLLFTPRFSWTAVEAAKTYLLEISTQPDFGSTVLAASTANTDYTPIKALANDQDYFWRVRAIDNQGNGTPYSEMRRFRTKWNDAPQLLTPDNNSIQLSYPFFSWEPVAGAERYQIQIDESNNFEGGLIADVKVYNVTAYTQPRYPNGLIAQDYYWRVRAVDAQGNVTPWSQTWAFQTAFEVRSNYIYPPYYHHPDPVLLPVQADRSIAWPLFMWDTAHGRDTSGLLVGAPPLTLSLPPDYYVLEVDDDPAFGSPDFTIETRGLAAAPTLAYPGDGERTSGNPFTDLQDDTLYYWRVQAYRDGSKLGGDAVWVMRYDADKIEMLSAAEATPMYPADGFEAVADPPVLGWQPVSEADQYRVQIARERTFTNVVDEAVAQFVNYVPWQGRAAEMPFGVYWWRVRAEDAGGDSLGDWSSVRRFHLSLDLVTGNDYDLVPIACADPTKAPPCIPLVTNPPTSILSATQNYTSSLTYIASSALDGQGDFELGDLHVMTDRYYNGNQNWVIAFTTPAAVVGTVRYGIYMDLDHIENEGATKDPEGKPISVNLLYRPEYAVYINRTGDAVSSIDTTIYRWNGSGWDPKKTLASIGGDIWYDVAGQGVQLLLKYTELGGADDDFVGSVALTVFSTDAGSGGMVDAIPPQGTSIDQPAFVSDMLMPLYPFDTPLSNPIVHYDMPPLRWRTPYFDSTDGYRVQVAKDAKFTEQVESWETYEVQTSPFFELMPATFQSVNAYEDNESYYWRVRIRHERFGKQNFFDYGPWSPPMRFKLDSRQVGNPALSTSADAFMTPTFAWDRVEGAAGYSIQIDDDANFSSPLINQASDVTSFTPTEVGGALLPGTQYHWRVAMRRSNTVIGHWTQPMTFTKTSLWPQPVAPLTGQTITGQPTFAWTAILTPTQQPRLAAPRYRLQVDDDPNFGSPLINVQAEATSYTPWTGQTLPDGTWYWRVALTDANNHDGPYSPVQTFAKQYALPTPVFPVQGVNPGEIPTLEWMPVDGAAYYKVEIADNEFFNGAITAVTDNTKYTPTRDLSIGTFYWRVQMFDADRKPGPLVDGQFNLGYYVYLPTVSNNK